ncbi:hypothetical protein IJH24_01210 [Candidatus Saccharibacteria bacterium]|nr:hypothetical protein [Candidatus Saccharibacteria bacterium]
MEGSNPFLKRLMKAKTEDVVHSSAYAQAQNREGIGVASTRGFGERMSMESNRTTVKGYRDSEVVNDTFGQAPKAKTYDPKTDMRNMRFRSRDKNSTATKRAMMPSGTSSAAPVAQKSKTPLPWKNPGISR